MSFARNSRYSRAALCALWLCCVPACGYRLLRAGPVFGCATLAVQPFREEGPIGLTGPLAAALTTRLMAIGAAVHHDPRRADGILSGSIALSTVPGATLSTVQIYNVDAIATATLHDATGQLLWRHDITLRESFLPPDPGSFPEPLTLETRRRVALARLAERTADAIAEALRMASAWAVAETPS